MFPCRVRLPHIFADKASRPSDDQADLLLLRGAVTDLQVQIRADHISRLILSLHAPNGSPPEIPSFSQRLHRFYGVSQILLHITSQFPVASVDRIVPIGMADKSCRPSCRHRAHGSKQAQGRRQNYYFSADPMFHIRFLLFFLRNLLPHKLLYFRRYRKALCPLNECIRDQRIQFFFVHIFSSSCHPMSSRAFESFFLAVCSRDLTVPSIQPRISAISLVVSC